MTASDTNKIARSDHFHHVVQMVTIGSGATREVEDYMLSRYACYLIVQNGDPAKPPIAAGQNYFALQTRRQELADELKSLNERQKRIVTRHELTTQNVRKAANAYTSGVLTAADFAIFQDHGYMGLYNGEKAKDIAERKGLKKGQEILDYISSTELASNLFVSAQTADKLERDNITNKHDANRTHFSVGRAVRNFIIDDLGGVPPEQLPTPKESVKQLEKQEKQWLQLRERNTTQDALFPADD